MAATLPGTPRKQMETDGILSQHFCCFLNNVFPLKYDGIVQGPHLGDRMPRFGLWFLLVLIWMNAPALSSPL